MNYLFFDIECANCFNGKGKICSFGYCLTDDKFNVIEQKDLIINPKSKFSLGSPTKNNGIKLAYSEEEFYAAPLFSEYYPFIKKLLTNENQIIVGHSVGNDASFLISEFERYHLEPISFKAYDTQAIHKFMSGESNDISLEKMCLEFNIDIENLHQSDWDAYLTMRSLQAMCQKENLNLEEIFNKYENAYLEIINGQVKKYFIPPPSISKKLFIDLKKKHVGILEKINKKIYGLSFGFSESFIEKDYKKSLALAILLKKHGCHYVSKISKINYYLKYEKEDENILKIKNLNNNREDKNKIKIITYKELLKLLNIKENEVLLELENLNR